MRRFLLVLVLVCVFAAMVLPAAALASPGTVKNAAGHKVGMVSSGSTGKVWNKAGTQVGHYGPTDEEVFVWHGKTGYNLGFGFVDRASKAVFLVRTSSGSSTPQGRAKLVGKKWILQRRGGGAWHRRGSASNKVSGWAAGAALWLLLWK